MELSEIRKKKKELEIDILTKLQSFEEETDCYIKDINVARILKIERRRTEMVRITLDIEI